MELELADVAFEASAWDVRRAIGSVLHGDDFYDPDNPRDRLINFKIELKPGRGGVQNNGHGVLLLPSRKVGDKFMRWLQDSGNAVRINGKKIRFFRPKGPPTLRRREATILEKTPYLPPELEEEREEILRKLDVGLHVDKVQFGVLYRPSSAALNASRAFSNEYEFSHRHRGAGLLSFEYSHKLIRIQLGDTMTEEIAYNIAIAFANIRKMAYGLDFGNPYVCFDLLVPPMLERKRINRELTGNEWSDNRKFLQRVDSLNPSHAVVSPYAHHLRIIMHQEQDIREFAALCQVAGLQRPIWADVDASKRGFFSSKQLHNVQVWVRSFDWSVAFQIEGLLRNGLLNTEDLLVHLREPINALYNRNHALAADILRNFTEALRSREARETPLECLNKIHTRALEMSPLPLPPGMFLCHHVTFTPTRMVLEGPYAIQSNRVIRDFRNYHDHFVRVDFRDEDRLQYRWTREVDGTSLLVNRVGGILKNGFDLGGRHFEFLAYSQSALREHAVWFVNPFDHPEKGWIDGQRIRNDLGDFSSVINSPSKYAARIAQAFTATDPSVKISKEQWEEVKELGSDPYCFTDGCGTISAQLGDMIWEALSQEMPEARRNGQKPWAYQIRFLGYKGMVSIDEQLEGIKMRLRPSMNKFKGSGDDWADIEIAQSFFRPKACCLNRPMVMVMEDRGVEKSAFLDLQEKTKAEIFTAGDTIDKYVSLLKGHGLGRSYKLSFIMQCLQVLGMGMKLERDCRVVEDEFLERLIHYAKNDVLRGVKHAARIPIPDSHMLVGVADEGPAYEAEGKTNVHKLGQGEIFACVQGPDDPEPIYIEGPVVITRNPVVHPGDVQRVKAVGKPPADKLCFFRNMKNVVVLPSVGDRSLASCLGGGDLDGDEYVIIKHGPLLVTEHVDPASYESAGTRKLERQSKVEDICDFIVEYINSDLLGLLAVRHLIIADQSKYGTHDKMCMELARLCSQAVDYPKNGIPVDIHDSPHLLIPYKPDWQQAEIVNPRSADFYESTRALGDLYRNISIIEPPTAPPAGAAVSKKPPPKPLSDSISQALKPYIERQIHRFEHDDRDITGFKELFERYRDELRYICMTHALSDAPEVRLSEEEVVVGTILAKCSQHRWRQDRTYRMRLHSAMLVRDIRSRMFKQTVDTPTSGELRHGLNEAWKAWDFAMRNKTSFGASSFGLIALGVIFDILQQIPDGLPAQRRSDVDGPADIWLDTADYDNFD